MRNARSSQLTVIPRSSSSFRFAAIVLKNSFTSISRKNYLCESAANKKILVGFPSKAVLVRVDSSVLSGTCWPKVFFNTIPR